MKLKDIDPFLCTHMIYASAALNDDGSAVKLPDGYEDFQQYVLYPVYVFKFVHFYIHVFNKFRFKRPSFHHKKRLMMPNGLSEAVNRRRNKIKKKQIYHYRNNSKIS